MINIFQMHQNMLSSFVNILYVLTDVHEKIFLKGEDLKCKVLKTNIFP